MDQKKDVSNKVFKKISREEVKMKPKCYFTAKSLFWVLLSGLFFVLAIVLASIILGHILDYQPILALSHNPVLVISSFPYILLLVGIVLVFFAAKSYRNSRRKCQHEDWLLLATIIFGALVIGSSISYAKLDRELQAMLKKNILYQGTVVTPEEFWSQPEEGTLSGVVVASNGEGFFLRGWNGESWNVIVTKKTKMDTGEGAKRTLKERALIKMFGYQEGAKRFMAEHIWNW